jgi:type VI secretion system protein ImpM
MPGGAVSGPLYCLPQTTEVFGWYGKLPGMGDFAQRRLPSRFVSVWDKWLQNGFEHLKFAKSDWAQSYLNGHIWFFALGPSVIGAKPWLGVLLPSVDSVGRYFPLTIAIELTAIEDTFLEQNTAPTSIHLLDACARVALEALENDSDAERFDALLQLAFNTWYAQSNGHNAVAMPRAARSDWHIGANFAQAQGFSIGGMPGNSEFSLLFASADEASLALAELAR